MLSIFFFYKANSLLNFTVSTENIVFMKGLKELISSFTLRTQLEDSIHQEERVGAILYPICKTLIFSKLASGTVKNSHPLLLKDIVCYCVTTARSH